MGIPSSIIMPIAASVLFTATSYAQINIGTKAYPWKNPGKIPPEHWEALLKTRTVLFLREGDEPYMAEIQSELDKVWTVTPIEVHPYQDRQSVVEELSEETPLSFLTINAERYDTDRGNFLYVYLELWVPLTNEKIESGAVKTHMARIDLHLSGKWVREGMGAEAKDFTSNFGNLLYTTAEIMNWSPGLLVKYLHCLNDNLVKRKERLLFEQVAVEADLSKLKRTTLYIVDHVAEVRTKNSEKPLEDPHILFKDYPYKYELISKEDLSDKLLKKEDEEAEPFYYLMYVLTTGGQNFTTVFRSDTGEIVYASFASGKYNFTAKNMATLAKKMK